MVDGSSSWLLDGWLVGRDNGRPPRKNLPPPPPPGGRGRSRVAFLGGIGQRKSCPLGWGKDTVGTWV